VFDRSVSAARAAPACSPSIERFDRVDCVARLVRAVSRCEMLNRFVCALLFTLFIFPLPLTWAVTPQKQGQPNEDASQARYAGSETCQACHDELHASFQNTAHARLLRNARAERNGCEACHGPGQIHVDNNGDRSKIVTYTDMPKKVVRQRCGLCHEVSADKPHVAKGVGCLDCHSMHHFQENKALLVLPATRLCQKCHAD